MPKIIPVAVFDCVVFGATGDLTLRKLLPALYYRFRDGQMPAQVPHHRRRPVGAVGRGVPRTAPNRRWQKHVAPAIRTPRRCSVSSRNCTTSRSMRPPPNADWSRFDDAAGPRRGCGCSISRPRRTCTARSARRWVPTGWSPRNRAWCWKSRSATTSHRRSAIIEEVGKVFTEAQTFRIDHYLGKETVQNLMALRFANTIFERLWTADVIDHVQITVAETVGLEGRGGYYDKSGALRDMVQNHMLQLLCLIAMEPPVSLDADRVRDEKLKVLRALKPMRAARGGAA